MVEEGRAGPEGLRERNKAQRRAAIIRAAFTLFAERGYDATTVADIAEAAEVSPRTVTLYFPSKQDIALARFSEGAQRLADAFDQRHPDESLTEIMSRWLCERHTRPYEEGLRELGRRMFAANPELQALRTARMAPAIRAGARAIADDLGTAPDDIRPRIAVAAAAAVLIEIADSLSGVEHDQAVALAVRFLEGGIATLRGTP